MDRVKILQEYQNDIKLIKEKTYDMGDIFFCGFTIERRCKTKVLVIEKSCDDKPFHCGDKTCNPCNVLTEKLKYIREEIMKPELCHCDFAPPLYYYLKIRKNDI